MNGTKIIGLKAQNVFNLKAIELDLSDSGNVVMISGKNEAGKSNILNAICAAIAGEKFDRMIREGEEKGIIEVKISGYTIKRVYTEKTDRIEIVNDDGDVKKRPQEFLNDLLGAISFDPLAFARYSGTDGKRKQLDIIKGLVGIDNTDLDQQRKELYEERTIKNRELKQATAVLESTPVPADDTPLEEQSIADLLAKLQQLQEDQKNREKQHQKREDMKIELVAMEDQIEDINSEIAEFQRQIEEIRAKIKNCEEAKETLIVAIGVKRQDIEDYKPQELIPDSDIQAIRRQIELVEVVNKEVRQAKIYRDKKAAVDAVKKDINDLTTKIDSIDQQKRERIAACKFPVEGLGIDDEGVLFGGLPFSQASTARKIRISTEIAMTMNPKLRTILIRDGNDLDSTGMKAIVELAKERDYQVFIEKVDETGKVGVYIESGEVKAINK